MSPTKEATTEKTKDSSSRQHSERPPRPEKVALVEEIKSLLTDSSGVVLTEYRGLNVADMAELRASLRQAGASFKIYKNTLVGRAVADLKLKELESLLTGPVGLAFVLPDADYSETARVLAEYKKTHAQLLIKGGFSNNQLMDAAEFEAFSKLPPLAVLHAQMAGALQAPLAKFAGLLSAVLVKFAGQLAALKEKMGDTAEADTDTESEPAAQEPTEEPPTEEPAPDEEEPPTEEPAPEKESD